MAALPAANLRLSHRGLVFCRRGALPDDHECPQMSKLPMRHGRSPKVDFQTEGESRLVTASSAVISEAPLMPTTIRGVIALSQP